MYQLAYLLLRPNFRNFFIGFIQLGFALIGKISVTISHRDGFSHRE